MKTILPFFIVVLLMSAVLIACESDDPTATPIPATVPSATPTSVPTAIVVNTPTAIPTSTPRPTRTAEPTFTPTPAPSPTPTVSPREQILRTPPANLSQDDLTRIAQTVFDDFRDAVVGEAGQDWERARATYSSHCLPGSRTDLGDLAFVLSLKFLSELFDEQGYTVEVTFARLLGEDKIFVTTITTISGIAVPGDGLFIYEDGRWVDSSCEEGRLAAGLTDVPEPGAEDSPQPSIPEIPLLVFNSDPSEHTLEEIARATYANFYRVLALGAADKIDSEEAQSLLTADCRESNEVNLEAGDDELGTEGLALALAYVDLGVTGVQRLDDRQAWIEFTLSVSAPSFGQVAPAPEPFIILYAFEDGQWRVAECRQERNDDLVPPDDIEDILRVSYIGETVQVQGYYEYAPYAVTVLGEPEIVDESSARVPARFTSIVERWAFESYFYVSGYMALPDGNQGMQLWETDSCEGDSAPESVELVKGGWFDGYICFALGDQSYQYEWPVTPAYPDSWLEYLYYSEEWDPQPLIVDLTQTVEAAESIRFENGLPDSATQNIDPRVTHIEWWEEDGWPTGGIGDPVTVSDYLGIPEFEATVLSEPEVYDSTTVRLRFNLKSIFLEGLDIHSPWFELTAAPDEQGRLGERWRTTTEDESGSPLPDSFHDVTLTYNESHEGWAYFIAPEGETVSEDDLPTIFWILARQNAYIRIDLGS